MVQPSCLILTSFKILYVLWSGIASKTSTLRVSPVSMPDLVKKY